MNNKKYEALEIMLQNAFEHGKDLETCVAEFPEFAEELRPLLQSSMDASALAVSSVPADVTRRGRARLLQHAAQMREAASAPRASLFDFRLVTVALTLLLAFFVSGVGLVRASSSALPGDTLYTIKRGWEDAHFWFANKDEAIRLQAEYEEERREEVRELLAYGRRATVQFEGEVISQNGDQWIVADVSVVISAQTELSEEVIVGDEVMVVGQTQPDGVVLAQEIILFPPDETLTLPLPTVELNDDSEVEASEIETPDGDDDVIETPEPDDDGGGDDGEGEGSDGGDDGGGGGDDHGDDDDDDGGGGDDEGGDSGGEGGNDDGGDGSTPTPEPEDDGDDEPGPTETGEPDGEEGDEHESDDD